MKTMKLKNDSLKRIKEDDVDRHISLGYKFCSKKEWKENVRDLNKTKKEPKQKEPKQKKSKQKVDNKS